MRRGAEVFGNHQPARAVRFEGGKADEVREGIGQIGPLPGRRALGDAMSLNVLMRIIPRAVHASGLLPKWVPSDVWARTSTLRGQRLPDAVLRD
jgi:hypothetical protein